MSRPARLAGFDYVGPQRYFLTLCTFARRHTLRDPAIASMVESHFLRTADQMAFAVLVYCLMPDHLHLLLEGITPAADLCRFVKRAKQGTGQRYAHRVRAPLWQAGYYERVLRPSDDVQEYVRYIVENPVRAGLVHAVADYPYVGSSVCSLRDILSALP
jgi:putative transposase